MNKYEGRRQRNVLHSRALVQVQESDPNFVLATFLKDFRSAFVATQKAWMAQDMAAVRHFVSDGIDEKFVVQFREQQRLGYREQHDWFWFQYVGLARFDSDGLFEVLTVKVTASLVERRVSLKTGATVGGSWKGEPFTEYWSLVRRRGTQTNRDGGRLLAGSCPNCGSPLQLNRLGSCQACDSLVRSGVYDWVLCEITQESDWHLDASGEVAARVGRYREQFDAGFSRQHLEDRAWVIMARLGLADALRDLAPLRKVALPQFSDGYELPSESMRTHFSINGLDLVGFVVEDEGHFALLQVDWWRNEKSRESLLVLFRQPGVQSNQETALLSAHCPSCGAPEESQATDACAACGQVTNTGKYGWVLRDFIEDRTSPGAGDWVRRMLPVVLEPALAERVSLRPAACLMWAIGELVRDNGLSQGERDVLAKCASRSQIEAAEFAEWVRRSQRHELVPPRPPDVRIKRAWLNNLVRLMSSEETVDAETTALLKRLARVVGLPHYVVGVEASQKNYWETAAPLLSDLPDSETPRLQPAACLMWAIGHLAREGGFSHMESVVLGKCAARNRIAAADLESWVKRAPEGSLAPPTEHGDLAAEEWLNQLVGFVLHDGRINGDARSLLTRLAEILQLPHYDVALAARKQAYRKRVARPG